MSTIICRHLTFGYPGAEGDIFEDLDLVIDTQWRSALVGRNGRGKTTLLRLIQGELEPDRGAIERSQQTAYFPQAVADPDQAVRNVVKEAVGPFRQWEVEMEDLLADGEVEGAEAYMEERRRLFVAQGYNIRKINQAYFAFYGSYATGPGATSPIGEQLRQLREESDSLKDFLDTVAQFGSYGKYLDYVETLN